MDHEVNPCGNKEVKWYILNYIGNAIATGGAHKVLERFNKTYQTDLEIFAPTYVTRDERSGKVRMRPAKLLFHYVFVRGTLEQVKLLCSCNNGFSFLLNRSGLHRYAIISDPEMRQLRNIARVYENSLPFYSLEDIDLEEGDLVEVVNGDFPGLIGTYLPKAKGRSGNIVLRVHGNIGTIAYDIKVSDIRVLSFASGSTRANDQIDAIVPHLLKALRLHFHNEHIDPRLIAKLTVFAKRMEVVEIPNQKLEAKLRAILYSINTVLGDDTTAEKNKVRLNRIKHTLTNPYTVALASVLIAGADNDHAAMREAGSSLPADPPRSSMQRMIAAEAEYYNNILAKP